MAVRIREQSRLKNARLVTIDGVEHWETTEYPKISPAADDNRYTASRYDRIDNLAHRFYGSAELWWIIALANDLELVSNDLYEGQVLRIPSGRRVFSTILRNPTKGLEGR